MSVSDGCIILRVFCLHSVWPLCIMQDLLSFKKHVLMNANTLGITCGVFVCVCAFLFTAFYGLCTVPQACNSTTTDSWTDTEKRCLCLISDL